MLVTGTVPPAPVDADQVRRALAPFGSSRMLPRGSYLDEPVLAWEREHFFGGWQCVGRSSDVAAGGMSAESVGEYGVLLTRDGDGVLRAFENACRHRGHELMPCGGSQQSRAIVCPYHAWTYRLDGSLVGAPGHRDVELDKASLGLKPVEVREWHGWVFVDRTGRGIPFEDHIGELEDVVAPYGAAGFVTPVSHEYDVAANWKVIIENYQECYHCSMIHPELCRVSPPESGENIERDGNWIGGWMDLRDGAQTMSLDGRSGGTPIEGLNDTELRTVMYLVGFPNLLVSLHPDYVMTHLMRPISAGRTHVECSWAFPREVAEREGFDPSYAVDFWDLTNRQDWAACEGVQRGLATPHYEAGPLAPDETGVYAFTSTLARAYQGRP